MIFFLEHDLCQREDLVQMDTSAPFVLKIKYVIILHFKFFLKRISKIHVHGAYICVISKKSFYLGLEKTKQIDDYV
jgi:hypothetical protein